MEAFDEAVRLTDGLVRKHPHAFWFKADLADIYGHLGDAQRRLGRTAEAAKSFRLSWDYLQPALERVPEQIAYQELAALAHERLAGLPGTERQEAEKHYREALRLRAEFVRSEPGNRTWQAAYLVALAHCGRHAEAATKAEEVLRRAPTSIPLALQAARCFAACAAAVPESEQKQQYAAKAAGALRAAVGAGCEDAAALRTDPDLAPLARDPALRLPAAQGTGTASP
jgi:tetratricopeptide (TPR) repeat protein